MRIIRTLQSISVCCFISKRVYNKREVRGDLMEQVLHVIIEYAIMIIYVIALFIILYGTAMSVVTLFNKTDKSPGVYIGESLDLGLRYLMVSEVLHTFTASTLMSLINIKVSLFNLNDTDQVF